MPKKELPKNESKPQENADQENQHQHQPPTQAESEEQDVLLSSGSKETEVVPVISTIGTKETSSTEEFKEYMEERNSESDLEEKVDSEEDEESNERSARHKLTKLENLLEELVDESDPEDGDDGDELRDTFLLWSIGYIEDGTFDRAVIRYTKAGYTKKLIRAVQKIVEDIGLTVGEAILDHKLFKTPIAEALRDQMVIDEAEVLQEYEYYKKHINIAELDPEDCVYTIDDFDEETLAKRMPSACLVETDSKFGRALERMLKSFGEPLYYGAVRETFVKYAIGVLKKDQWAEVIRPFKRRFTKTHLERVQSHCSEELFDLVNINVIYGTAPETICEHVGRVTMDDWNYVNKIVDISKLIQADMAYADLVEPILEEDKAFPDSNLQVKEGEEAEDEETVKDTDGTEPQ